MDKIEYYNQWHVSNNPFKKKIKNHCPYKKNKGAQINN